MLKVNPTVITLGIAGILAIAVGFYVNSVSWGPVAEEKTTQATASTDGAKAKNGRRDGDQADLGRLGHRPRRAQERRSSHHRRGSRPHRRCRRRPQ